MRTQVERLTKLATDLLDLSRLDAGRLRIEHEEVDLGRARAGAGGGVPRAGRARAAHVLELAAATRCRRTATTSGSCRSARVLVENALVHTPPGTTVRLSVGAATAAGRRWPSRTTGPASRRSSRRQVFERFYRLDGAPRSGSGLGLAIARELAEVMGGRLELEPTPGGRSFTLVAEQRGRRPPAISP